MSATNVMEAKYQVIDEELMEAIPSVTKGAKRSTQTASGEAQADEVAALITQTLEKGLALSMERGADLFKLHAGPRLEAMEKSIADASAKVLTLGKPLCLYVKFNDLPVKKLTSRVSPLLRLIIAQAKLGQHAGGWPLIKGPAGTGKTVLARQLSETFGLTFYAINGAEGVGESSLYGRWTKDGFIPGPVHRAARQGGVCLLDEFDAFNDNVLLSLNTWLASKVGDSLTCPMSGETFAMHKDCYFVAAANSNGKGGDGVYQRNRLDGSSLNRFAIFTMTYDTDLERELCPDTHLLESLWAIRVKLQEKKAGDFISTRDIARVSMQVQAGFTVEEALSCIRERFDAANRDLCAATAQSSKKGGK